MRPSACWACSTARIVALPKMRSHNGAVAIPGIPKVGLINSYGLFWKLAETEWEVSPTVARQVGPKRSRRPRMLGRRGHRVSRRVADFYRQPGIYILYGNHGAIYVGITGNPGLGSRIRDHLSDRLAGRWDKFSWFAYGSLRPDRRGIEIPSQVALEPIPHRYAIRDFEAAVIRALDLPSNEKRSGFRAGGILWDQVLRADVGDLLKKAAAG